jgi:glutathione peroxidase-family protein
MSEEKKVKLTTRFEELFPLTTLTGEPLEYSEVKGKVVLFVNVASL